MDGIDLLRGLAIFFVLMNHINIRLLGADVPYTKYLPPQLLHFLVWNGQLGVQMFFAVSGFLITSITVRRWGLLSQVSLRGFYLLRFARIAPLLFLLLAILSGLHFAHVHHFVVTAKTGGLGRALLAALTFHVNVLEAHRGYLPANWDILWSLSVEEMFYLFFPVVCRLFGRGRFLPVILLGFVVLGPFARTTWAHGNEIWEEYSYLGGMEGIALGCLTARYPHTVFARTALDFRWRRRCHRGIKPDLLLAGVPRLAGTNRSEHDPSWAGHMSLHCRNRADPMESPAFSPAITQNRPIQLRGLFDAYVRRVRFLRSFSCPGQADATRPGAFCGDHTHCRVTRRPDIPSLFRADESTSAPIIRPGQNRSSAGKASCPLHFLGAV
jgi:hypothetical protein